MEEELRARIKTKIDEKVRNHEGTWIDWQYLHDAATLLTKCRYTLQYTCYFNLKLDFLIIIVVFLSDPFAYYMENTHRKDLFGNESRTLN
jgi:ariadne-2